MRPQGEKVSKAESGRTGPAASILAASLVDALPAGVLILDANGRITHVNQALLASFGYTRDDLLGRSVDILVPDALRSVHGVHRQGYMSMPDARPMGTGRDLSGQRADGSTFPVQVGLNPFETTDGTFVVASVVDLTERDEAAEIGRQVVENEREFERLIAGLSVQLINLPADRVDDAIRQALQRIGERLGLDRCTFFRIDPDGALVEPVSWQGPGTPPITAPLDGKALFPWAYETLTAGQVICFSSVDEVPSAVDRATYRRLGTRSAVTVPLLVGGRTVGAVGFNATRGERTWPADDVHRLRVVASVFGSVLARRDAEQALRTAHAELERLRDQLQTENLHLRREVQDRLGSGIIVGRSPAVRRVLEQVEQVAATDATVLLLGETGTGKELFATQIHGLSHRRGRPMVRVNCSAIPATLIESELFGREKGAFTGALARQVGRFELSDQSSIFLDEIGDLPAEVQVKLLRVIEERQIERLGSPKGIKVNTRIIAATHRNLEQRIAEGQFREDLFYRLNVFPIQVPPLRERVEDIPLLVWRFVEEFSRTFGKRVEAIPRENMDALQRHAWPGNIRELRNVVERAMIVTTGTQLTIALPTSQTTPGRRSDRLADVQREHIRGVLESAGWRIRGPGGAADRLGVKPTTLETRMAKLGLARPKRP